MSGQAVRDTGCLTLASVNLQIEQLVPTTAALPAYEGKRSSTTSAATNGTTTSKDSTQNQSLNNTGATVTTGHTHHLEAWTQLQQRDRMQWAKHFKMNKKGGLVYQDQETLKKQQGVFKEVMLQVGSQLLSGKMAVRISLPIRIFEPRSLLERVADGWNYAPTLLKKAALTTEPVERMKFAIAFVSGGFHFCIGQLKPFNPILGETYQATYADGTQIFMEHISHHPVKSAFTITGPKGLYHVSGVYEFESMTSRNSIVNHQIGTTKITFHDGHAITYTVPQIKMSGLLFGDRVVELIGTAKFVDASHHLVGEVTFNANSGFLHKSQSDDIKGHIYPAKKSAKYALSTIQGSWLSHLQFDDKVYWHVESEPVFEHQPVEHALPSDVRYREDLIALKNGDAALAQTEKLRLEERQRADAKLREAARK